MKKCQLVVIGGGPAGLAAAAAAREAGVKDILILERDNVLGGILNQCIHNGFGLHTFHEELTGPEYASRFILQAESAEIAFLTDTMVIHMSSGKEITAVSKTEGLMKIHAESVILAMGCRERPRGALNIPGFRPAGIYTAGAAQRLVNIEGLLPGKEVLILGSGDIGLIMARRMTLEGAHVHAVAELLPYSGGLKRNIVQCLDDFGIPLLLEHTVVNIEGKERLTGVVLAKVDEKRRPIPGSEQHYDCDTLLLSVGLLPENELTREAGISISQVTGGPEVDQSMETEIDGVFACGNVLHVHDLVDYVTEEASHAGINAARYLLGREMICGGSIRVNCGNGVRYCVPQKVNTTHKDENITFRFRTDGIYYDCKIAVYADDKILLKRKKRIMTPGEMEQIILTPDQYGKTHEILTLQIEEVQDEK